MKIVFLAYNYHPSFSSPGPWIQKIQPLVQVMIPLAKHSKVYYAGHLQYTGHYAEDGVEYLFLPCHARTPRFPRRMHRALAELNPDIVIVLGFHFPLQVIQLRRSLGKKVMIIARHHADRPFTGWKKQLQKIADSSINTYLFNSLGNAREWLDAGIIRNEKKIIEIPAGSTGFQQQDKEQSRRLTNMVSPLNFLWVGRLEANKDPMTVLDGFQKYFSINNLAMLHMIYQEDDLLAVVKDKIAGSPALKNRVRLVGKVAYEQLPFWYSAADYFISGSHREGGSYALMEAMACGCIPVVTHIPAAMKTIDDGKAGYYYEAGNGADLFKILSQLDKEKQTAMSRAAVSYFEKQLSPRAIAARLRELRDVEAVQR
jgi:glycosyltransferase involved in cell wall biosynthesis